MQIQGPAHVHGAQPINGPHRAADVASTTPTDSVHGADQLDISPEADMISRVHESSDVRADRLADIKQQIDAGTYETAEKLDVAVGRLLNELAG